MTKYQTTISGFDILIIKEKVIMKIKNIVLFTISLLVLFNMKSFCQTSKTDSLAIKYMNAIRITDGINSPIPDSIRNLTIGYFLSKDLKPEEYFTTKHYNLTTDRYYGYINVLRLEALKNIYHMNNSKDTEYVIIGAAGGEGDDIFIVYNKEFSEIIEVTNAE